MKAIIEMIKGDRIRRHLKYDKSGLVDLGLIKDVIPINDGVMPVHYGYIPATFNNEDEEIDILIFSDKDLEVGEEIEVEPIALIIRADGDDKVIAVDDSVNLKSWPDVPAGERELIEKFFSYHHEFKSIQDAALAKQYVEDGYKQFASKK